ncbi:MAG: hypothetical protein RLZZ227_384 [Pseudomonadota bacterium]
MKLQRLLSMSTAEIFSRGVQEASKTFERLTLSPAEAPCLFRKLKEDEAHSGIIDQFRAGHGEQAERQLARQFQTAAPLRFFAGAAETQVPDLIASQCHAEQAAIIRSADGVCRGDFPILGYGTLSFGKPTDWHLDPLSGKRAPQVHWSKIDPLNCELVGDHKVVWELNRHQWLLDLGQAYRFTGNERYAKIFAQGIGDWIRSNPPGVGINWASSLEVSMRLMAWCWALFLFRGSRWLTPPLQVQMIGWIETHASYIERYLSTYFSPNTHLTGEALGLFYCGTLLPGLKDSQHWINTARKILIEQLHHQVHPDGVYFEQATRYQYYTVDIYMHFVILARRNRQDIPEEVNVGIRRMLDFLLTLRRPDGSMPQIGDADGGWLLPFVRRSPDDFSALFATAAVLYHRADYAWAAGKIAPETLWLLGANAFAEFQALHPAPPHHTTLQIFREGGYAVMRNGWQQNAHHLIFDTGPLGCGNTGGHGHADLLSIQCCVFGEPYIVDGGTGSYRADDEWRNYFRTTGAHSTVMIDGHSQAKPSGPFTWQMPRPAARLLHHASSTDLDLVEAAHDAYSDLDDPVGHRRRILFVKTGGGYWVIVDDLSGCENHKVDLRFQFAPLEVKQEGEWLRVRGKNGGALLMRTFAAVDLQSEITEGELAPASGWVSPNYGQRVATPAVTWRADAKLPLRVVTLLYPLANADDPAPDVTAHINGAVGELDVTTVTGREHCIRLDDDKIVIRQ